MKKMYAMIKCHLNFKNKQKNTCKSFYTTIQITIIKLITIQFRIAFIQIETGRLNIDN